jgi:hypothetical protein
LSAIVLSEPMYQAEWCFVQGTTQAFDELLKKIACVALVRQL